MGRIVNSLQQARSDLFAFISSAFADTGTIYYQRQCLKRQCYFCMLLSSYVGP